jgi:hypothetical protein
VAGAAPPAAVSALAGGGGGATWSCGVCGHAGNVAQTAAAAAVVSGMMLSSFAAAPAAGAAAAAGLDVGARTGSATYVLVPAPGAAALDAAAAAPAAAPMVIFCIDTSGSMQTATTVPGGIELPTGQRVERVSRLQCAQAAVHSQLRRLMEESPGTVPVVITFGSSVTVWTDGGRSTVVNNTRVLSDMQAMLSKGAEIAPCCTATAEAAGEDCVRKTWEMRTSGCTALGPALACAVGLAGGAGCGSAKIVLCTDGCANIGVGKVQGAGAGDAGDFYAAVAARALEQGTSIHVVTMEGEDCSLENLGTAADITAGHVEVVDPVDLTSKVAALMSKKTLATQVELKVVGSPGITLLDTAAGSAADADAAAAGASAAAGGNVLLSRALGSVTLDADLSFSLGCSGEVVRAVRTATQAAQAAQAPSVSAPTSATAAVGGAGSSGSDADENNENAPGGNAGGHHPADPSDEWCDVGAAEPIKPAAAKLAPAGGQPTAAAHGPLDATLPAAPVAAVAAAVAHVQVQLTFTRADGERRLLVMSVALPLCADRALAEGTAEQTGAHAHGAKACEAATEQDAGQQQQRRPAPPPSSSFNGTAVGLRAVHAAAGLAQQGLYEEARVRLISTQRLLQRAMRDELHQNAYLSFVVQAEKLDQFMREVQQHEAVFGGAATKAGRSQGRDDSASQAMYKMKSVSVGVFDRRL